MKLPLVLCIAAMAATATHAEDIVIGQSVALSGSNADIGRDMRDGALAVFAKTNAANTLGRPIRLVTLDNANNRARAAENTQALIGTHNAVALFGYNSATNSLDALPLAAQNRMLFFAPFSGAARLRADPNTYTIRASYKEEAARIVQSKHAVGADRAVVLHYDDDVGHGNFEAVASAFAEAGLKAPRGVAVKRGATLEPALVDEIVKDSPHYLLATTQYSVVGDFLKATRDRGTPVPVAALSFVNPDELAESVGDLARGTVVAQVMPTPRGSTMVSVPVIKDCAESLAALNGGKLNYTSLESCIAAKALVAALKKAGPKATRESVLQAMGTLGKLDLNGFTLNFGPNNRQGSSYVELTILSRGNRFVQ